MELFITFAALLLLDGLMFRHAYRRNRYHARQHRALMAVMQAETGGGFPWNVRKAS